LNFKAASGISPRAPPLVASHLICADPNVRLVNGNVQCFRSTGTATYDDGDQPEPSGHGECGDRVGDPRSEEHTSELQSRFDLVCRLLLEKKKKKKYTTSQYEIRTNST